MIYPGKQGLRSPAQALSPRRPNPAMRGWPRLNKADPINQGLVGYWSMDGATVNGALLADITNNNAATLVNGPTVAPGIVGHALKFNGSNQYANAPSPVTAAPLTMCAWVYLTSSSVNHVPLAVLSRLNISWDGWYFATNPSTWLFTCAQNQSFDDAVGTAVALNTWTFLCGVASGSSSRSIYVNGKPAGSTANTRVPGNGNYYVDIGYSQQGPALNNYFPGSIDDVRIYNRALGPAEILRLYTDTSGGLGLVAPRRVLVGAATALISSLTEAATATDTVSGLLAASGAVTEAATASDTVSGAFAALASITEAATASDTPTATGAGAVTVLEAAVASDAITSSLAAAVAITEAATAADTASGAFASTASVTDPATAADALSGSFAASASVTDAASATDAATPSLGFLAALADAAVSADTATAATAATASVSDAASATDNAAAILAFLASVSEGIVATDVVVFVPPAGSASVTEPLAASDAPTAIRRGPLARGVHAGALARAATSHAIPRHL